MTGLPDRRGMSARCLAWSLAGVVFLSTGAARAGDAVEGRKLAEMWCVSCHTVSTAPMARDAAPPFCRSCPRQGLRPGPVFTGIVGPASADAAGSPVARRARRYHFVYQVAASCELKGRPRIALYFTDYFS